MSTQTLPLESGDVVPRHSLKDAPVAPQDIAVGVIIGRTSEFFAFFVYAIASVLVFPQLVFPFLDRLHGTLLSFAIFALGFVARPIGTLVFMSIDRLYGRGTKLTLALFLLGVSTVAIAFLPGHATLGAASGVLLALLRIGQGFASGGEWDGLASLLALTAPEKKRGWYAMIPQLGAPLGLILASGLFAFFVSHLPSADFLDWGWRFPFFVAFAINVVALFARLRIVVSPQFAALFESRELQPTRVMPLLRREGRNLVIGAFAPLASFALFHMVSVFPLSWIKLFTQQDIVRFLLLEMGCAVLSVLAIAASGPLADQFGRRTVLASSAAAIAGFSGFAPQMLGVGFAGEVLYMLVGSILLGIAFGQSSGVVTGNLSAVARYTGAALTADLAWLFGAGFAPLVALFLAMQFGLIAAGAYLLTGALATLVALMVNKGLARHIN